VNELCGAVIDGTLTDTQRARLAALLRDSGAARQFYVRALGQSASLHTYASEMHAEAPDAPVRLAKVFSLLALVGGVLPAAAALVLGLWYAGRTNSESAPAANELVARLTGSKDSKWLSAALAPGERLAKNQRLELAAGFAEITFDSGARVTARRPRRCSRSRRRGTARCIAARSRRAFRARRSGSAFPIPPSRSSISAPSSR